ncbi:Uncharacterised protein [Mycobacteroides abscessus subsp. abscessus]|nr:Uncharacterised protein [Mycobacteroides abscessus subsp. abscessus]
MGSAPQQGLPGGIQLGKGGGYWWGITTGCWLAALSLLGNGYRGSQSAAILLVIMVVAAAAVGAGKPGTAKRSHPGAGCCSPRPPSHRLRRIFCPPWLMLPGTTATAITAPLAKPRTGPRPVHHRLLARSVRRQQAQRLGLACRWSHPATTNRLSSRRPAPQLLRWWRAAISESTPKVRPSPPQRVVRRW